LLLCREIVVVLFSITAPPSTHKVWLIIRY
jgi:hypothetical protein